MTRSFRRNDWNVHTLLRALLLDLAARTALGCCLGHFGYLEDEWLITLLHVEDEAK